MKFNIKFTFSIFIFLCWSTLSIANNDSISMEFPNYRDESLQHLCKDDKISLNFSNAVISSIRQNFISSSLVTCLNLVNTGIQEIDMGSFDKLPNLTKLFLSNNVLSSLFSFGGHENLEVLIMNNAVRYTNRYRYEYTCRYDYNYKIAISGRYPNLEILSIRNNQINELQFREISSFPELHPVSEKVTQDVPFPKLKIMDLSKNCMKNIKFAELVSSNLHFLDLHENELAFFDLSKIGGNLSVLNLDNNQLRFVGARWNAVPGSLTLDGLENVQYLSISGNKIESMSRDAFQDTEKLIYLNLSRNDINYLEPELFAKLQSLSTLDLSFNKFNYVPHISHKMNINLLYLNHNQITELNSNTFMQMPKLTKLFLERNAIHKIDVKAFDHLFVLEKLDLSWNNLSFLPEGWTEPFVSLKYLDLSHNKFTSLESLSLTSALSLIEVYLTMNSLEYLNIRYFENLPQNLTVYFMSNQDYRDQMGIVEL